MQNKPRSKKYNFLQPERIFTALLIAALLYLIPASHSREAAQQPGTLREYLPKLIPAVPGAGAQCAAECEVTVCLDWDPNPCGTHEWDIGCCLEYGTECDPGCSVDPDPGDGGGGGPSYQPPTISHVLNCSNSGVNGWCVGSLTLDLSASDPQGQTIIISGDIAGTPFACPNGQTTCPVPLPEGTGTANYRVDSATGLSAAGSTTYQLDATTPQINGNISGSIGTFDWFVTQAVSSASASDSLSGIASFEVSVDAAPYTNYQSPITFSDGVHTIQYRAYDNAGNYTETDAQEIKVDTAAPSLNVSTTGANGLNGWYISSVTLTPTASDSMSGIALLEISLDGGEWVAAESDQGTVISEGVHTVQFRATDNAGNVSQTAPQEIKVDTITPGLSLEVSGTRGQNDWYVSNVATTPTASDATSGVALVEMTVDGGLWTTISNNQLRLFTDGVHTYQYKVTDNAGNVTETPVLTVKVDTTAPILTAPTSLNVLEILRYQLSDPTSGLSQFSIHVADKDNVQPAAGNAWALTGNNSQGEYRWYATFGNGATAGVGLHPITLRVTDMAGNETTQNGYIEVTWQNLVYMEMTGKQNGGEASPAPSGSSGTITYTGGGSAAGSEAPSAQPAPQPSFGGGTNTVPAGQQSTTVTESEAVPFAGVAVQTGVSAGNQTTSSPISNPNPSTGSGQAILWGAAAAAMLGMTLADWQRRREEEAAALARYASSGGGGSDDDEMPEDVRARRRGKVMAKNQAKRNQESRWEAARVQNAKPAIDEETFMQKTYKKVLNAANVLPGMSLNINNQRSKEQGSKEINQDMKTNFSWVDTLIQTATATATLFFRTPTSTFTPSQTPTPTNTPTPSNTPTTSATPTASATPTVSSTPTLHFQTPTNTSTPSNVELPVITPTPLNSGTQMPTASPLPPPTPMNPNDQTILEWVVDGLTEDYTPGTYHYPAEPNLPTGGGGMPGGLNDTNVVD